MFRVMLVVLSFGVTFGVARPTWGGPYLLRSIEMSPATSQKECGGQVVRVLRNLQKEGRLSVDKNNASLAVTNDSTVHVDCIFVGRNEQGRNQWIVYIAIASTNGPESENLLKLLRSKFRDIVRID